MRIIPLLYTTLPNLVPYCWKSYRDVMMGKAFSFHFSLTICVMESGAELQEGGVKRQIHIESLVSRKDPEKNHSEFFTSFIVYLIIMQSVFKSIYIWTTMKKLHWTIHLGILSFSVPDNLCTWIILLYSKIFKCICFN